MQQTKELPKLLHELPPLPYGMDALAPHISRETLEYHYGKHHRAYVDKLNELVHGTKFAAMGLADLVRWTTGPLLALGELGLRGAQLHRAIETSGLPASQSFFQPMDDGHEATNT